MKFDGMGNEQSGIRPGVVFQNNIGNEFSPNIIALPLTSAIKKGNQPTHVLIKSSRFGIKKDSIVLCENPERMSKCRIIKYITKLSNSDMERIAAANLIATSAISFMKIDKVLEIWEMAVRLNNHKSES